MNFHTPTFNSFNQTLIIKIVFDVHVQQNFSPFPQKVHIWNLKKYLLFNPYCSIHCQCQVTRRGQSHRHITITSEILYMNAEESDSDSDEDLEGGVRHDLMMADEKVPKKYKINWLDNCIMYTVPWGAQDLKLCG